jgi:hypothetical protein
VSAEKIVRGVLWVSVDPEWNENEAWTAPTIAGSRVALRGEPQLGWLATIADRARRFTSFGEAAAFVRRYRLKHPPVRLRQNGDKVVITVGDEGEQVDAEAFARSVKAVVRALEAIDRDMHGRKTVTWAVSDLRMDDPPPTPDSSVPERGPPGPVENDATQADTRS